MSRTIREQMQADLVSALKGGDVTAVSVLRTTLAALANAEAVDSDGTLVRVGLFGDVERRRLSDADIASLVVRERAELESVAVLLDAADRAAEAARCRARAAILDSYVAA